jgi:hypothetical protein
LQFRGRMNGYLIDRCSEFRRWVTILLVRLAPCTISRRYTFHSQNSVLVSMGNCVIYGFSNTFLLRWYLTCLGSEYITCTAVPFWALEMLKLLAELGFVYVSKGPTNFDVNWPVFGIRRSRYSYWLWVGRQRGRSSSPGRVKNFLHVVQTGSGDHPASYPMAAGASFPRGKAAGAWS